MDERPLTAEISGLHIIGDEVARETGFKRLCLDIGRRNPQRTVGGLHQPHAKLQATFRVGDA